ncbi:substrate-binding domain-containing protein [Streptomyces hirsutus]|uniref:substrate-binding domain-containing protein n=1 Tax=Streptomyces hirsutus TaxID=35620 RepID=UPI0006E45B32|nr:substrate-binding domain-containing protein [Streptomyces hirsutus]
MRRAGLRIPDGLSVIGIDDHPVAELTGLTTVRQPVREQGELAGRMLLDVLRGEETEHDVVVPKQLVIRGSAAPSRS